MRISSEWISHRRFFTEKKSHLICTNLISYKHILGIFLEKSTLFLDQRGLNTSVITFDSIFLRAWYSNISI